jgi:putative effector of murein hydrolase
MRQLIPMVIPVACVMAFLMSFDRTYALITEGGPIVKVLLGAGVIFFVWLFLLWDDLVQSE